MEQPKQPEVSYINTLLYRELFDAREAIRDEDPTLSYLEISGEERKELLSNIDRMSPAEVKYETLLHLISEHLAGNVEAGINEEGNLVWALADQMIHPTK